jgi:hypothetical protein
MLVMAEFLFSERLGSFRDGDFEIEAEQHRESVKVECRTPVAPWVQAIGPVVKVRISDKRPENTR